MVFATVFALVYTLDFVELMRRAGDAEGATPALMAQLALFRTPAVAEQVLPFAVLFGSMAALLQLSRKLELVVARAAGISAWQFLQPGILVALMIGVVSVAVYNPLSAYLKQQATEIEARSSPRTSRSPRARTSGSGRRASTGKPSSAPRPRSSDTTTIAARDRLHVHDAGRLQPSASRPREATLHDGYWELNDARVLSPNEQPQSYASYLLASNLDPSQVRQSFTPPDSVPFWNLDETIAADRAGRARRDPLPPAVRRAPGAPARCSSPWCSWRLRFR